MVIDKRFYEFDKSGNEKNERQVINGKIIVKMT